MFTGCICRFSAICLATSSETGFIAYMAPDERNGHASGEQIDQMGEISWKVGVQIL